MEQQNSEKDAGAQDGDSGVENPRVGGSIPSPDTKNQRDSRRGVSPDTAGIRDVRNKNVAAEDLEEDDWRAALAEFAARSSVDELLALPLAEAIAFEPAEVACG